MFIRKVVDFYGNIFEKVGNTIGADSNPVSATIIDVAEKPLEVLLFATWVLNEMGLPIE